MNFGIFSHWRKGSFFGFLKKKQASSHSSSNNVFWAFFYLLVVFFGLFFLLSQYSTRGRIVHNKNSREEARKQLHGVLLEVLDTYVRYQHYYKELYGRFTYDLEKLGVRERFGTPSLFYLKSLYEFYIEERENGVFAISAVSRERYQGKKTIVVEKISVDEKFRIKTNFSLPEPSEPYLQKEMYRILRLYSLGKRTLKGIASSYFHFDTEELYDGEIHWYAKGIKGTVKDKRYVLSVGEKGFYDEEEFSSRPAERFSFILDRERGFLAEKNFSQENLYSFLEEARFAQYAHKRETGKLARTWKELDVFFAFQFKRRAERADSFSLEDIDLGKDGGTILAIRGTKGSLLGKYLSLDRNGNIQNMRYTDVFINELRKSGHLLQGESNGFQVKELGRKPARNSLGKKKSLNEER